MGRPLWNPENSAQFIEDELFTFNITPVPTSNPSIKSQEQELKARLPEFRVIRSRRRKRSIRALRQNGAIEIHIPDRLSRREELEIIPEMVEMVLAREAKSRRSDEELLALALEVKRELLPEFQEIPASVTWRNMRERWGSCTTVDRTIRISDRLNHAPKYVLKYILFHELIHLKVADHGPDFQCLLERYDESERAEAYLEGFEAGSTVNSDIYL